MLIISMILRILASLLLQAFFIYQIWNHILKPLYKGRSLIRKKVIPFSAKLQKEYGVIYPNIMDYISSPFDNLDSRDDLRSFFFIFDRSFVIVSMEDENLWIEIPFSAIAYHNCYLIGAPGPYYNFKIELGIIIDGRIKEFSFSTLEYNHRLDKKYSDKLFGEDLYKFVKANFVSRDDYYL
ncbi:MAG: hypothetical protein KH297_03340 [Firmicutes bacterium]|nr:hypothetical protein [Bacillota bacterium]